jgi:hypothetical protein
LHVQPSASSVSVSSTTFTAAHGSPRVPGSTVVAATAPHKMIRVDAGGNLVVNSCSLTSSDTTVPMPCDGNTQTKVCATAHTGAVTVPGVAEVWTASPLVCDATGSCPAVLCPQIFLSGGTVTYSNGVTGQTLAPGSTFPTTPITWSNTGAMMLSSPVTATHVCSGHTGGSGSGGFMHRGGDLVRQCQVNGTWSGAPAVCGRECCRSFCATKGCGTQCAPRSDNAPCASCMGWDGCSRNPNDDYLTWAGLCYWDC